MKSGFSMEIDVVFMCLSGDPMKLIRLEVGFGVGSELPSYISGGSLPNRLLAKQCAIAVVLFTQFHAGSLFGEDPPVIGRLIPRSDATFCPRKPRQYLNSSI